MCGFLQTMPASLANATANRGGNGIFKEHRFHAILPLLLNSTSGKPRWTHKKIGNASFQFKGSGPGAGFEL
ncbi:hypothetical protein MEA186_23546 [Mesorhizobium amorphae CCNWGS0123]|uniref:Uncharacterized protein n=1 Tax=Mesorhizobium amorphae CCNWGS0123 TaxID=1082933 RepID=G6YFG0_9HYPH|nr:hypothetical protein MEA186_23546 [Mesorhizobium amorphae CCNWGS0123]